MTERKWLSFSEIRLHTENNSNNKKEEREDSDRWPARQLCGVEEKVYVKQSNLVTGA